MNTTRREISKLLSLSDTALYTVGDVMSANISAVFVTTEGACRQSLLTYLRGLLFVFPSLLILMTSYCVKRCVFYCHLSWVCEHSQNTCWYQFRILCVCVFPSLTLSWSAGHICPTYKESFQVRWDKNIPLSVHAAIYLEVPLFRWTSQNAFSRETTLYKWYCVQCCIAALHTVSLHSD